MIKTLRDLYENGKETAKTLRTVLRCIVKRARPAPDQTRQFWDNVTWTTGTKWWELPGIDARWNRLITGDPEQSYYQYVAERYFTDLQPQVALTIGCGDGYREHLWSQHYRFQRHDAFDLSPKSIEIARAKAAQAGLKYLNYFVADANTVSLPEAGYDVVIAEQSLHHVEHLEHVLWQTHQALRPDGIFVVNEFVGPSRFQWPPRQLEIINAARQILPRRYRASRTQHEQITQEVRRPLIWDMIATDPSEAVRSAEIPKLLRDHFRILEWRDWGGTILQMLFDDITGNFDAARSEDMAWIAVMFEIEDLLMSQHDIGSDFIFAVLSR